MNATSTLLEELETRAGPGASVRHGTDAAEWRVAGTPPLALVEPQAVDGIAAVLAFCSEAGLPVEPAGAGTWLAAGRTPGRAPVVVSTARLTGTTEYEPADLVVGVRAGATLGDLARELAVNGQYLPLDPPGWSRATVGATLALGAAGPLRAQHRTPRDLLLGVQVVTGDGRTLNFGGRVVKNVAGYDLVRLLAGSRGTLGVITSAFLLLRSSPPVTRTYRVIVGSGAEAAAVALAVRDRMEAEALEVLGTSGTGIGGRAGEGDAASWSVLVRLAGSEEAVAEQVTRLRELGAATREDAGAPWNALSDAEAATGTCVRLGGRPAELEHTVARAVRLAGEAAGSSEGGLPAGWRLAAHGADGIVRIWTEGPGSDPPPDRLAEALGRHAREVQQAGGSLLCPILPERLRGIELPAPTDQRLAQIVAGLRQAFDPAGIMSPGRHGL
jgi:glycolate oxidase FAD binding subunit